MIVSKFHKAPRLCNQAEGEGEDLLNISDDPATAAAAAGGDKGTAADGSTDHADATNTGDEDRGDTLQAPTQTAAPVASPAPTPAPSPVPTPAPTAAPAAADGEGSEGNRIPQARFNEVVAERRAAEERARLAEEEVARLRAAAAAPAPSPAPTPAPPPAFDVKAKETEYAELLADGEFAKAADLRMEINNHVLEQATAAAEQNILQRQAQVTVQAVADQAVSDYPYLDTDEGAPAMAAIIAERKRLEAGGKPAHEALQAAVDKIAPLFGAKATASPAAPANPPGKDSTAAAPAVDTRPAAAARRGAQAAEAQPPALKGGQGNEPAGTVDALEMSEAQFEALTPEEKKRLRGD